MISLFLIRHGQTESNAAGIITGSTDVFLSEEGREQARLLGEEICGTKFDCIYASGLIRSQETAYLIKSKSRHELPSFVINPLLRERDFGSWEGRPQPAPRNSTRWIFDLDGDCEPVSSVIARAQEFRRMILLLHPGQTILAVGHGFFNSCLTALLLDGKVGPENTYRQINSAINFFFLSEDGEVKHVKLNDIDHLARNSKAWQISFI